MDGNLAAEALYEARCEQGVRDYNEMLIELQDSVPEDYPAIMEMYGFGDLDMIDILKDLGC